MQSRIVLGPNPSLAAKDVYGVSTNDISGNGESNLGKSPAVGEIKPPKGKVLKEAELNKESSGSENSSDSKLPLGAKDLSDLQSKLSAELSSMPEAPRKILKDMVEDPSNQDTLNDTIGELLSNKLGDGRSKSINVTDDIIDGVWGSKGAAPNPNCRFTSDLFNGSSDIGSSLLLNLLLLAKMIECGIVDKINELMDGIENPMVKEAVGLLGVGTLLNSKVKGGVSDNLGSNGLIRTNLNELALFDSGKKNGSKVSKEIERQLGVRGESPLGQGSFYANDVTQTPYGPDTGSRTNSPEDPYSNLFNNRSLSTGVKLRPATDNDNVSYGFKRDSRNSNAVLSLRQNVSSNGMRTDPLKSLIEATNPRDIKDGYPNIESLVLAAYGDSEDGTVMSNTEVDDVIEMLTTINPDWYYTKRGGETVLCLETLRAASPAFILGLSRKVGEELFESSVICYSYNLNNINRLLRAQYSLFS